MTAIPGAVWGARLHPHLDKNLGTGHLPCPACGGALRVYPSAQSTARLLCENAHYDDDYGQSAYRRPDVVCPNPQAIEELLVANSRVHVAHVRAGRVTVEHPLMDRIAPGGLASCRVLDDVLDYCAVRALADDDVPDGTYRVVDDLRHEPPVLLVAV